MILRTLMTVATVLATGQMPSADAQENWTPPRKGIVPIVIHETAGWPKSQARVTTDPNGTSVKAIPPNDIGATIPPVEFDHPYKGDMTVKIVRNVADMQSVCAKAGLLGCAQKIGEQCVIYLRDEETLRRNNRTHDLILRHEMGHCNGWPADHSGARLPKEATR